MSRSTRSVSTINRATIGPLAKRHPFGVWLLRRADSGPRSDDGWAKAQPAVVLILERLSKWGHGFKAHPTDWEKPGIKPRPLWFTRHMLPETLFSCLWLCSLAVLAGWVYVFCGFMSRSTRRLTGFKASKKTGQQLKVSSDRLRQAGSRTCDPCFTRHRFIRYVILFCGFPGYKPVPPGWFKSCWFYVGNTRRLTERSRESILRP